MTRKQRVALISLVASLSLAGAKLAVGLMIGSLALITDAFHSGTDFLATFVTLMAVRIADRPPDETHPYGHGKFEALAALAEAALLLVFAGIVSAEAVGRLREGAPAPDVNAIAFAVLGVEIVVNIWRAHDLSKVARETGSAALAADALHFGSDVLSSLAVLAGFLATLAGFQGADSVATLAVAVLIAVLALKLLKTTIDQLTDAVPRGLIKSLTRSVDDVPGVVAVDFIRIRKVGHTHFVDVGLGVPRSFAQEELATLKSRVTKTIADELGEAEVVVSTQPVAVSEESVREQVLLAAVRVGIPVHHITIQHLGDRLSISLDIEVEAEMPLGASHDAATQVEEAIRAELGGDVEVETHLEPMMVDLLPGEDVDAQTTEAIFADLRHAAFSLQIADVHNVRVRQLGEGIFVVFHCRFPAATATADVHERLDQLERAVRERWPSILRIVSHPEPVRE
ncbi:Ferrous-iron efflux pump FieF [Hartmannibacter diazotrophicus]|uniref:Ferrous-iron efflux pump FieF n=1 Tax=Hartmannibacter diazotrophicus TaxID=1482074 RepID=A0A2C9D7M1_9HYPH|nr:cation diffusion facilitator family transporter [Hartmannibacter diazotrophicus]SON56307.1 Ferrous-iron efflux pump FieF [Hartmannibacter diazotrophicus]